MVKYGSFVVGVSKGGKLPVKIYVFKSYKQAYGLFRFYCNVLGWLGTFHYLPFGSSSSIRIAHRV